MAIRASVGLMPYRPEDLEAGGREALAAWRGRDCSHPCFIDPGMLDELTGYLLDRAEPGPPNDRRFFLLLRQLIASACVYRASDGHDLLVLGDKTESAVLRRLADFDEEDQRDLRSLCLPLSQAMVSVGRDGGLAGDASAALSAWAKAAGALDEFLSKPRRSTRFGLDDMLVGIDGLHALIDILEIYRRLLLAAGRALNALGAATIGRHDFRGPEDAVNTWRVSQGAAARQIGLTLNDMAAHTPGVGVEAGLCEPVSADGSWILPHSRLGQRVTGWALAQQGHGSINFAAVGATWPDPGAYDFDDGGGRSSAACALLRALSGDGGGHAGVLYGTDEVVVGEDLAVTVPERLLEGERTVYAAVRSDEFGSYLSCVTGLRRADMLAELIADEQSLHDYAWDGVAPEAPDNPSSAFEEEFSALALKSKPVVLDTPGRLPLSDMPFDGLERGARLVIVGDGNVFHIAERSREERRVACGDGENPIFGDA